LRNKLYRSVHEQSSALMGFCGSKCRNCNDFVEVVVIRKINANPKNRKFYKG